MTTIASEIQRIKSNIANTYTVLEEKGATLPVNLNSNNLASCASTVTGGGSIVYPKYSAFGNVTFNNGVASNFSRNTNYLKCPNIQIASTDTWSYIFKFNTGTFTRTQAICGFGEEKYKGFATNLDTNGIMSYFISSNGSSWDIDLGTSATIPLVQNTDYYIKRYFTGTQYKLDISATGEFNGEEVNYITVNSSTPINQGQMVLILGLWYDQPSEFQVMDSIDLKTLKLYINDQLVYTPYEV